MTETEDTHGAAWPRPPGAGTDCSHVRTHDHRHRHDGSQMLPPGPLAAIKEDCHG